MTVNDSALLLLCLPRPFCAGRLIEWVDWMEQLSSSALTPASERLGTRQGLTHGKDAIVRLDTCVVSSLAKVSE